MGSSAPPVASRDGGCDAPPVSCVSASARELVTERQGIAKNNGDDIEYEGKEEFWAMSIMEATGTCDIKLAYELLSQAGNTRPDVDKELINAVNNTLVTMYGIAPRDTLEGLLGTQMVGAHNLAMECMRRARHKDMPFESTKEYISLATKLMRTFTTQIEALNRYRSKGQQKVTVEHVHVNEGGQAIVGNISQGGGGNDKNCD